MANHRHDFEGSAAISHTEYDETNQILYVGFHSGGTHGYKDVSKQAFDDFKACESAGRHFHANIKNKFEKAE